MEDASCGHMGIDHHSDYIFLLHIVLKNNSTLGDLLFFEQFSWEHENSSKQGQSMYPWKREKNKGRRKKTEQGIMIPQSFA